MDEGNFNVSTGITFLPRGTERRWMKHEVGMDRDAVRSRLDGEARDRFDALLLPGQILVARAVTEISVGQFRRTRHDPDYNEAEADTWRGIIERVLGEEGLDRLLGPRPA